MLVTPGWLQGTKLLLQKLIKIKPKNYHIFHIVNDILLYVVTADSKCRRNNIIIMSLFIISQFSSVQSLSHVQLFATPWTAACQASLSIINSQSLLKLISIKLVMPSNHLILCRPLLLPLSIFPSIGVFSNESVLCIRWPKYRSFSFSISPSNEYSGLFSFRMDWLDILAAQGTLQNSSLTPQFKSIGSFTLSFLT